MPTVNIFYKSEKHERRCEEMSVELKSFLAEELSCKDIDLNPSEVSIRLIKADGDSMIAPLEIEVTVHAFDERVKKQDEIANRIRQFLLKKMDIEDVRVWVLLPQLGHSW